MSWLKKLVSFAKGSDILPKEKESPTDTQEDDEDASSAEESEDASGEVGSEELGEEAKDLRTKNLQSQTDKFDEQALNEQIMDDIFEKAYPRSARNKNGTPDDGSQDEESSDDATSDTMRVTALPQFFARHVNAKFEPLKKELSDEVRRFEEKRTALRSSLENLRNAKLLNDKLPTRVMQIMEGNRESYIRQHLQFIQQCNPPSMITYRNCATFCDYFSGNISRFAKQTAKSHMVLAEFFNNEVSAINRDVKGMTEVNLQIKDVLTDWVDDFTIVEKTKDNITDLLSRTRSIAEIQEDIATTKEKIAASEHLKDKLQRELEELRAGSDFSQFNGIDSEKKRLWRDIKSIEDDISHIFGILDRPLRKLQRVIAENKKVLDAYVSNPSNALLEDHQLEIIAILDKLRINVQDGTLGFVDKEKEKILQRLDETNKLTLAAKQTKYRELRGAMKVLDEQMKSTKVLQDIDDTTYKINHTQEQIMRLNERLISLQEQQSKLALDDLKMSVSERLSKITGKEVKVE